MPDWKTEIRALLASAQLDPAREAQVVDEVAEYLEDAYEDLLRAGSSAEEARDKLLAELRCGELVDLRRFVRVARPPSPSATPRRGLSFATLWNDLRYAARQFRLSPGFAAVAILSLALGVGANTAIFQLLDAVRLRSLPVPDPQQLATIHGEGQGRSGTSFSFTKELSYAQWDELRKRQEGFSQLAAFGMRSFNLKPTGEARYVPGMWVSGTFFDVLGIRPALGRLLSPQDDQPACGSSAAVLSYSFWQREYGGQPEIIGRTIILDRHPFEIVGVTPPSFTGLVVGHQFEVAVPVCAEPLVDPGPYTLHNPTFWFLDAVGRLKPGWTLRRASAQLEGISPALFAATLPAEYDSVDAAAYLKFRLTAVPGATGESPLRRQYGASLWLLLGISGLVLLIACANIANLMMARAGSRQREMAVRLALGASRGRLVRQLLTEALLLAVVGALLGTVLAQALSRILVSFLGTEIFLDLHPDWRVLAFASVLALLTCLFFGLAPALQASRTAPGEALKSGGGRGTAASPRFTLRRTLVVAQVAMSLVLLTGAFLFVRTLANLLFLDPGFDPQGILIADVDFSARKLPPDRIPELEAELLARARSLPGVASAAASAVVPVSGSGDDYNFHLPGASLERKVSDFSIVSPGYFSTLRTPLVLGRDFNEHDTASATRVAIVNQALARKLFGGADPVGRTIARLQNAGQPDLEYQVVGVVKDAKYLDMREDFQPIVYVPLAQSTDPESDVYLLLRSNQPPEPLVAGLRNALPQVAPGLVLEFKTFPDVIRERLVRERLMATLAGFFGALAVLLAMIGLYGVISYMVVRRRNEIGIRMALGATPARILRMVVREAGVLLAIGVAIGVALSLVAAPAARSLLFGLKPTDPLTLTLAACGLAVVAVAASVLPARRAAALDPMVALRDE